MVIAKNKKLLCVLILFVFVGSMFVISLTRNNVEENLVWQYFTEENNPQWNNPFSSFNYMEREVFLTWFGAGVRTTGEMAYNPYNIRDIRLFPDIDWTWEVSYNPNVIQYVRIWQDDGLLGLGILGEGFSVDNVFNHNLFPGFPTQSQQDIRDLLTGGFIIIGDSENRFEAERFLRAITHIENMGGVNNIQGEWHDLLTGD